MIKIIKFKIFENENLVCIIDIINMSEIPKYVKQNSIKNLLICIKSLN